MPYKILFTEYNIYGYIYKLDTSYGRNMLKNHVKPKSCNACGENDTNYIKLWDIEGTYLKKIDEKWTFIKSHYDEIICSKCFNNKIEITYEEYKKEYDRWHFIHNLMIIDSGNKDIFKNEILLEIEKYPDLKEYWDSIDNVI